MVVFKHITPLVALVLFLGATNPAYASPPDTFGFGSRSVSLGGAVTASVEDGSAAYYNPAGLARSGNLQLQLGYFNQSPLLNLNGERSNVERHGATLFGLVVPATFGGDFRIAFGMGLQLPDQRVARTRSAVIDRPRWELYDTRNHRLYLSTHLAISPVPWLSFGAGLVFQSSSDLTLDIRGNLDIIQPEEASRLEHQFKGDLTSVRSISAGIQLRPHPRVNIGIVYRSELHLESTIVALGDATALQVIPVELAVASVSTNLYSPHQLSLGIDFRPIDRLMIALEVTYNRWSRHPSLIGDQEISIETGVIEIGEILALPPIPLNLHDTFVPRVGLELAALQGDIDLNIRAGYVYENTPFPTQTGITNFVDNDKHTVSLGLGLQLNDLEPTLSGFLAFSAHFAYARLTPRDHLKDSPVDVVGDYESAGHLIAAGLDITLGFN